MGSARLPCSFGRSFCSLLSGHSAPARPVFFHPPRGASSFWKTPISNANADALTAVLPLDGGLILSELSLGSPRHAVPAYSTAALHPGGAA